MLRLSWPLVLLGVALVALIARKPGLIFSRAFFPVLLVAAIYLLVTYVRRPQKPR